MEHTQTHSEETIKERFDRILWELRQPLDMSRVKRRQAPGLGSVPYLEGFDVINRANEIFGYAWSFDLISEPLIARWHKKILVWNQQERRKVPVTDANGNFTLQAPAGSYKVAISKTQTRVPPGVDPEANPDAVTIEYLTPQKYASPTTSGLTLEVKPGMEPVTWDLTP